MKAAASNGHGIGAGGASGKRTVCRRLAGWGVAVSLMLALTATAGAQDAEGQVFVRGVNLSGAEFGKVPGRPNHSYLYPTGREIARYVERGVTVIRLPFKWERLQPVLGAPFDPAELARLAAAVDAITGKGVICLIDPHNYGWYVKNESKHVIGSPEVPASAFVDFWTRLASQFKERPRVWFGLMNEPHGIQARQWRDIAEAATTGIRKTGARNKVLVPGIAYSTASTWVVSGNAAAMAKFHDPGNNFAFEVHQYLDRNSSGTSGACAAGAGRKRLAAFEQWLRSRPDAPKGFLGEFAAGDNDVPGQDNCQSELTALLRSVESQKDLWLGWTVWGAGRLWAKNYHFRLEAVGASGETNLMRFYERYWKRR